MKKQYNTICAEVICLSACDIVTVSTPDWDLGEPDED